MSLIFLAIKPLLLLAVRKVFKKQMKVFAVEMLENYAQTTDNDVDDQLVARVKTVSYTHLTLPTILLV